MLKSYRYRLFPTKSQVSVLERQLELCRQVYNDTLAYRKNAYESEGKSISKYETHNLLPKWKKDKPELKEVFSQTLQNTQERVDLAFKAFFRRVKAGEEPGYPRFKGRGQYDSFSYPQINKSFRHHPAQPSQGLNTRIEIRIQGYSPSSLCSDFDIDLVCLIPIVSQAVCIPEFGDFFNRLSL